MQRAKALFHAQYVNEQPHSGSSANLTIMFGLLGPGDVLLGARLDAGGHLDARGGCLGDRPVLHVGIVRCDLLPLLLVAHYPLVLGALYALQLAVSPVYNVVQYSYRMVIVPDELQGRVNSVFRMIAFSFNPLGAGLSGVLLQTVGGHWTVVVFTLWMAGLAVIALLNSAVRGAPRLTASQ